MHECSQIAPVHCQWPAAEGGGCGRTLQLPGGKKTQKQYECERKRIRERRPPDEYIFEIRWSRVKWDNSAPRVTCGGNDTSGPDSDMYSCDSPLDLWHKHESFSECGGGAGEGGGILALLHHCTQQSCDCVECFIKKTQTRRISIKQWGSASKLQKAPCL